MAQVRLRGTLKKMAGDGAEHSVPGGTVAEVLIELERTQESLSGWILDERGRIRRHINVFVNGEQSKEDTTVSEGDRVEILPAISGG
ncbi:MAG TPA: MoaD/ThiS family protein [Thermoleophilaceae bacterium]|nr:MoaD/ThiS family protein [Thermoleophilaceae bacterium]